MHVTLPQRARLDVALVRKIGYRLALAAALLSLAVGKAAAQSRPSELSGYLTLASDVRKRGLSQLAGDASVQLGIDYQAAGGFFAGGGLKNVAFAAESAQANRRERLLELYAGYLHERGPWDLSLTLGHYRYPGTAFDYDYTELTGTVSFRDRYYYSISRTRDLLSFDFSATDHVAGVALPLPADFELGVAAGRFDPDSRYASAYSHYNIGVSRLFGRFGADLRRYDTSRAINNYLGRSTGERWVLSVSYAIRPRH